MYFGYEGKDVCEQIFGLNGSSIGSEGDVGICDLVFECLENIVSLLFREKVLGSFEQCFDDFEYLEVEVLKVFFYLMKVDIYNIMMDLYGKVGDLEKVFMMFRDMVNVGVDLDIVIYNIMIYICS